MRLPLSLRFLLAQFTARPLPAVAQVVVVALAVGGAVAAFSVAEGTRRTWLSGGPPDHARAMSRNAVSALSSRIDRATVEAAVATLGRYCRYAADGPLCSPEIMLYTSVAPSTPEGKADPPVGPLITLRGVRPAAFHLRENLTITEGRRCTAPGEVMVGALAGTRLGSSRMLAPGRYLWIAGRNWRVVGQFEVPGDAAEVELWCVDTAIADIQPWSEIRMVLRDPLAVPPPPPPGTGVRTAYRPLSLDPTPVDAVLRSSPGWNLRAERADRVTTLQHRWAWVGRMLAWITALLAAVMAAGVMGMLLAGSLTERRDEIRMLARLGASPVWMEWRLTLEALAPATIGMLLGLAAGAALDGVPVRAVGTAFRLHVTPAALGLGALTALLALAPALRPALRGVRRMMATA